MGASKDRLLQYDLLRIVAAFSVVMLHTCAQMWYEVPVESPKFLICNSWNALVRFGVPIFVMISGALFLAQEKPLSLARLYRHNILHLVVVYGFWSFLYGMWDCRTFDLQQVENPLKVCIHEWVGGRYHLWFLPMLIGLYILLPLLRVFVSCATRREVHYFVLLFLVFQIGRETLRVVALHSAILVSLIDTSRVELVCSYAGYFVLGYVLREAVFSPKQRLWIYAAGILGGVGNVVCANVVTLCQREKRGDVYDSFTIFTCCMVVALFVFFSTQVKTWSLLQRLAGLIRNMAADTLGIYLLHVGVLEWLYEHKTQWFLKCPLIGLPLIAVCCFGCCLLFCACIRRIPFVGRLIA